MIQNEVSILRRVKHPNIVLLIEEMDVPTELYLVMELVKVCVLEKEITIQGSTLFGKIQLFISSHRYSICHLYPLASWLRVLN